MRADRIFFFPRGGGKEAPRKEEVIRYLCEALTRDWKAVDADTLESLVTQRESALPTRLSPSLAVPHAVVSGTGETHLAAAVISSGVRWDSDREHPVRLVMLLAGNRESHLGVLSELARRLR
ncbi:MAG: PTS sugar transporter subunit IIA, partial [Spirochaetales bacterium]|nr:PTS sugar transporter subunit IIA [Spirochaetales bacterium]